MKVTALAVSSGKNLKTNVKKICFTFDRYVYKIYCEKHCCNDDIEKKLTRPDIIFGFVAGHRTKVVGASFGLNTPFLLLFSISLFC